MSLRLRRNLGASEGGCKEQEKVPVLSLPRTSLCKLE